MGFPPCSAAFGCDGRRGCYEEVPPLRQLEIITIITIAITIIIIIITTIIIIITIIIMIMIITIIILSVSSILRLEGAICSDVEKRIAEGRRTLDSEARAHGLACDRKIGQPIPSFQGFLVLEKLLDLAPWLCLPRIVFWERPGFHASGDHRALG